MTQNNVVELKPNFIDIAGKLIPTPAIYSTSTLPGIDSVVASHFPNFINEDHPKFIKFIETYYKFMEGVGGVLNESKLLMSNQDIDTSSIKYTEQFFREYLTDIPRNILTNKSTLLKHIKQFYRSKGTENSYKFLFRILFNIDVELYYPKVDILRVSDGKWIQNKTIKITDTKINGILNSDIREYSFLRGKRIYGKSSNSSAFIEKIIDASENGINGIELILNKSSITGNFLPNEEVTTKTFSIDQTNTLDSEKILTAKISQFPIKISIKKNKTMSTTGNILNIINLNDFNNTLSGQGCQLIVKINSENPDSQIDRIDIFKYGIGYNSSTNEIKLGREEDDPVIIVTFGTMTNYPGYYANEDGHISAKKFIHDGYYYQQFSYVTNSNISKNNYEDSIKKLLHPIGFKHFAGVKVQNKIITKSNVKVVKTKINISTSAKINPKIKTDIILKNEITRNSNSTPLGSSNYSISRDKYTYKPFLKYNSNLELSNITNPNYFGNFDAGDYNAITPIKTFKDFGNGKPVIIEGSIKFKTNICPDAVVIHRPINSDDLFFDNGIFVIKNP